MALGAPVVELHTGRYCELDGAARDTELQRLRTAASACAALGLECHMGHGLAYNNVEAIAAIPEVMELNIGHFLVGEAIFIGWKESLVEMRRLMDKARGL
jgi:pyridoxine 5-phosphate synthase